MESPYMENRRPGRRQLAPPARPTNALIHTTIDPQAAHAASHAHARALPASEVLGPRLGLAPGVFSPHGGLAPARDALSMGRPQLSSTSPAGSTSRRRRQQQQQRSSVSPYPYPGHEAIPAEQVRALLPENGSTAYRGSASPRIPGRGQRAPAAFRDATLEYYPGGHPLVDSLHQPRVGEEARHTVRPRHAQGSKVDWPAGGRQASASGSSTSGRGVGAGPPQPRPQPQPRSNQQVQYEYAQRCEGERGRLARQHGQELRAQVADHQRRRLEAWAAHASRDRRGHGGAAGAVNTVGQEPGEQEPEEEDEEEKRRRRREGGGSAAGGFERSLRQGQAPPEWPESWDPEVCAAAAARGVSVERGVSIWGRSLGLTDWSTDKLTDAPRVGRRKRLRSEGW
jgi:hypothetical protein